MNDVNNQIADLANRVGKVEADMATMQNEVEQLVTITTANQEVALSAKIYAHEAADNAKQAVMLLEATKGVAGIVAKHGPRVIAAIVGVLAYKGLVDPETQEILRSIFAA